MQLEDSALDCSDDGQWSDNIKEIGFSDVGQTREEIQGKRASRRTARIERDCRMTTVKELIDSQFAAYAYIVKKEEILGVLVQSQQYFNRHQNGTR